jgi:signal transduction histidine kinase
LTAGIAHEIKNPLNFVNNFSRLSVELIDELQEAMAEVRAEDEKRTEITELTDTLRNNLSKIAHASQSGLSLVLQAWTGRRGDVAGRDMIVQPEPVKQNAPA